MLCPQCQKNTDVIDSRGRNENRVVRRRRECLNCGHRFTTHEYALSSPLFERLASNYGMSPAQVLDALEDDSQ